MCYYHLIPNIKAKTTYVLLIFNVKLFKKWASLTDLSQSKYIFSY